MQGSAVNASFIAEIGRRIAQGDNSGGKTASAINQTYTQLENRGELGLAQNAILKAATKIKADEDLKKGLLLQLRGEYARIVEEKVAADPNYDVSANMSDNLEAARASS